MITSSKRRSPAPAGSIHARFARALRHAPMMAWMADAHGSLTFVNRSWLTFTGLRLRGALGDGWTACLHPEDLRPWLDAYLAGVNEQRPLTYTYRVRRFDDLYRSVAGCALPMHETDGRFAGYVGTCLDVTGQRESNAALEDIGRDITRQKEPAHERDAQTAMLDGLFAHMNDGVFAETTAGQIAVVNGAFCRIFDLPPFPPGVTAAEVRRLSVAKLQRPEECCGGGIGCHDEYPPVGELRLKDGRIVEQEHFSVTLEDARVIHVWQFRDITKRKREEEELRTSRHRLRDLSAYLETAREEERRDLGRTLHDEVGQLLTGIRLEVASAVERFRAVGTPAEFPVVDRLQAAVGLVDLSIATVQRVTSALRPPVLEHLGLLSAIRWEAAVFRRRTGIRCRISAGPERVDDRGVATVLYRILLEALTNVARHAHAGTVWISVRQRPEQITMEVRDNGKGISDEALRNPTTMGLLGMRERAIAAGGEVRITRRRSGGTSVQVTLPLPDAAKSPDDPPADA